MEIGHPSVGTAAALVVAARPEHVLAALDPAVLTAAERRRSAVLRHAADRAARDAAHLLVRWCAAELTGLPAAGLAVVQRCADCGSTDHGRPSLAGLPDVHVSLAHARGAVAAAAGRRPVGVDVECLPGPDLPAAGLALTPGEAARVRSAPDPSRAFLRYWVRKECLVKLGVARLDSLARVDLAGIDPDPDPDPGDGNGSEEQVASRARPATGRYGTARLVDWYDEALDAVVAAAGHDDPVVVPFPAPVEG